MDNLRVNVVMCVISLLNLSLSPSSFIYRSSDSRFVSLYYSAASLSSCSSVAFFSSASSFVSASSFPPLSSFTSSSSLFLFILFLSSSSFSLHPLSSLPQPSVLSPALSASTPPPPLPSFLPLPPGFPTLYSSSTFATSSFSSSFPSFSLCLLGPLSLSSVFSTPVLLFPIPLISTLLLFSRFLFLGLHFLSGSCIDYFGLIFSSHALVSFGCWLGFLLSLSSFPPLAAVVAWDISAGSSVLLSALRSSSPLLSDRPTCFLSASVATTLAPSLPFAAQSVTYFFLYILVSWCFGWPFGCFSFSSAHAPPSGVPLLSLPRLASSFSFCSWPFLAPSPPGPAVPVDTSFAPGFAVPSVPDSVHAQICRLSVYIVCGFLCGFSCFFSSSCLGLVSSCAPFSFSC